MFFNIKINCLKMFSHRLKKFWVASLYILTLRNVWCGEGLNILGGFFFWNLSNQIVTLEILLSFP